MPEMVKTMKLHIHPDNAASEQFRLLTRRYADACTYVSSYMFDSGFALNYRKLQEAVYRTVRNQFGLKAQFAVSVMKSVTARYKTVQDQLRHHPYRYKDESGTWHRIPRTLEWLRTPVVFKRPQADFVRGRDYSFVKYHGETMLSLNTFCAGRARVSFDVPGCFEEYFDGTWRFGGGKLVFLKGEWYFHISMKKACDKTFSRESAGHVVGIDRGLRFLAVSYDEGGRATFVDGKAVMKKRDRFRAVRAGLQSKGTKSAKRALKRISGRENRWMSDVNHRISKTLVTRYGSDTLFVLEDLTGVSFSDENLGSRSAKGRSFLRTWTFYQLEQYLAYKAHAMGSEILKVKPEYTSQRCPGCGRIRKENRNHILHEYVCDCCGYRSNDDRIGAMNIQYLGTQWLSGIENPEFGADSTK